MRASVFALALISGAVLIAVARPAAAAEVAACSDTTPNNTECTPLQELGYCLGHAIDEYVECVDDAGVLKRTGCNWALAYDVIECFYELKRAYVK